MKRSLAPPRRAPSARFALCALLACCGPSPATGDASGDARAYALALAAPARDGYAPLGPDAGIEMRLGFQGFRYTRLVLVAGRDAPALTQGRAWLEIDGFDRAEQVLSLVEFSPDDAGAMVSRPVMLYANDVALERAAGRRARITVTLEDRATRASASHEGVVQWDPGCVEDPQFQCVPVGDGGAR